MEKRARDNELNKVEEGKRGKKQRRLLRRRITSISTSCLDLGLITHFKEFDGGFIYALYQPKSQLKLEFQFMCACVLGFSWESSKKQWQWQKQWQQQHSDTRYEIHFDVWMRRRQQQQHQRPYGSPRSPKLDWTSSSVQCRMALAMCTMHSLARNE